MSVLYSHTLTGWWVQSFTLYLCKVFSLPFKVDSTSYSFCLVSSERKVNGVTKYILFWACLFLCIPQSCVGATILKCIYTGKSAFTICFHFWLLDLCESMCICVCACVMPGYLQGVGSHHVYSHVHRTNPGIWFLHVVIKTLQDRCQK